MFYLGLKLLNHDGAGSLTLPTLSGKVRICYAEYPRYRRGRHTATLETTPNNGSAAPRSPIA